MAIASAPLRVVSSITTPGVTVTTVAVSTSGDGVGASVGSGVGASVGQTPVAPKTSTVPLAHAAVLPSSTSQQSTSRSTRTSGTGRPRRRSRSRTACTPCTSSHAEPATGVGDGVGIGVGINVCGAVHGTMTTVALGALFTTLARPASRGSARE
jgi:hypothetical protein